MNSHERRERNDPLDLLIRDSLRASAGEQAPRAEVRQSLLARAGRRRRRRAWQLPTLVEAARAPGEYRPPVFENRQLQIECLFRLRLGWFSYNHLMR